jgi:hypothetical protein
MGSFSSNYDLLIAKIDEFIRKYYLNKIIRGSIYLAATLFASYILVTIAEYYGNFNPFIRTLLFYSFIGLNLSILTRWIILPFLAYLRLGKTIDHEQASEIIGNHFGDVKDKLLNTLQLKKLADSASQQRILIEASINQRIADLRPVPFASAIAIGENRKYLKYMVIPLTIIVLIGFVAPSIFSEGTERLLNHNKRFIKKAPFEFVILNKKLVATQGDDYEIQVKLTGNEIPQEIYIEDGANSFKLNKESIIRFNYTFKNIQENKKIRLLGGEFASDVYTIEVKRRPTLLNFDVFLQYPAYLGKQNETISNSGDLTVPIGTHINWKFHAKNTDDIIMGIGNRRINIKPSEADLFNYSYRAMENMSYFLRPVNNEVINRDSVGYQLHIIPDLSPAIDVTERVDSLNTKSLNFVGQANDDHGLTRVDFHYKVLNADKSGKDIVKAVSGFDKDALQSTFYLIWNQDEANAKPGQQIEYYFEVFDNDGVNGSKSTRTPLKTLNLPSTNEIENRITESEKATRQKMEQAIGKASQLEQNAKRINEDLISKKGNLSYDERKQIEDLLKQQKSLEELIRDLQKENEQNISDHEQLKDQSQKVMEQQKQLQELLKNVFDEKIREMLKNLEKLLDQNNNKPQTQQQLTRMQFDNKNLAREMQRIKELYEKLNFKMEVNESIEKLKEIAEDQKKLSEETSKQDPKKDDAAKQDAKKDAAKQDAKKDDAAKQDAKKDDAAKQDAKKDDTAKQDTKKDDAAKQDAKKDAAKQDPKKDDAAKQGNKDATKQDNKEKEAKLAELKQDQDKLKSDFEKLLEELKELAKKNEALKDKTDFETPEKESKEAKQQQEQSSKNLDKKNMKEASENQENASEKMQEMAGKMEQEQEESEEQQNQVNVQALREILKNLLTSSFDEENLMKTIKSISPNDPNYVSLAQKQRDIKDNLAMIQDSLYSLSKKVPQIQSVVNKEIEAINQHVDMALDYLPQRRTAEASSNQQYAMTSINNLALMLSDALNNMQMSMQKSKKSGQGKKPSMSQLSKMQQKLNENMQKAREQMQKEGQQQGQKPGQQGQQKQGQGQNNQMSEDFARMAREQQMIRQQMQQLNREENKDGKNSLGDLDKLAKEMEQTETDLLNKKIQMETLLRQQEIMTKLLDAEKAERERETDPKRESKEGKDQTANYKIVLEEFQKIKQRQTELLKTLPPALNSFYKIKIEDYFKLLNPGN